VDLSDKLFCGRRAGGGLCPGDPDELKDLAFDFGGATDKRRLEVGKPTRHVLAADLRPRTLAAGRERLAS